MTLTKRQTALIREAGKIISADLGTLTHLLNPMVEAPDKYDRIANVLGSISAELALIDIVTDTEKEA